ncbi:hypothetical protein [Listeria booriae]|uniref:hypothetical protein n=1 Tax=Listeria booriae TaxID=1552123 RepID=UPI0016290117|nr:hypothetical protein [Listeria booriae]MBC2196278.1 hypothetical protein [Listeria booriae]
MIGTLDDIRKNDIVQTTHATVAKNGINIPVRIRFRVVAVKEHFLVVTSAFTLNAPNMVIPTTAVKIIERKEDEL